MVCLTDRKKKFYDMFRSFNRIPYTLPLHSLHYAYGSRSKNAVCNTSVCDSDMLCQILLT